MFVRVLISGCYTLDKSIDYIGKANQTISGIPLQRWSSQTPHGHGYTDQTGYMDDTVEEEGSFCRNPIKPGCTYERWPWCFTLNPTRRWEFCYTHDFCSKYFSLYMYIYICIYIYIYKFSIHYSMKLETFTTVTDTYSWRHIAVRVSYTINAFQHLSSLEIFAIMSSIPLNREQFTLVTQDVTQWI